jgi:hypothetical protein
MSVLHFNNCGNLKYVCVCDTHTHTHYFLLMTDEPFIK